MEKGGGGQKSVTLEDTLITTTISAALGGYSTAQGSLIYFFKNRNNLEIYPLHSNTLKKIQK
jgi:hypothetical protein